MPLTPITRELILSRMDEIRKDKDLMERTDITAKASKKEGDWDFLEFHEIQRDMWLFELETLTKTLIADEHTFIA